MSFFHFLHYKPQKPLFLLFPISVSLSLSSSLPFMHLSGFEVSLQVYKSFSDPYPWFSFLIWSDLTRIWIYSCHTASHIVIFVCISFPSISNAKLISLEKCASTKQAVFQLDFILPQSTLSPNVENNLTIGFRLISKF
jgi:hypothetical protein